MHFRDWTTVHTSASMRFLILLQGIYMFVTAIWPLLSIETFMLVTGYKTDIWLVKTVAALILPMCLTMGSYVLIRTDARPPIILGASTAVAFMTIDIYYVAVKVISPIYLADAGIELCFLSWWIYVIIVRSRSSRRGADDEMQHSFL
jgi:hypothetical protein